ncbi:EMILIN-3 [Heterocephalus glaber]|uniref:EMILIN-3 n=1 Tax=Heterocephalus glaber TaxID=10181 RepID=G5BCX4_HETGA|nr:EMILIN-3 [Heterocephalus glaber]
MGQAGATFPQSLWDPSFLFLTSGTSEGGSREGLWGHVDQLNRTLAQHTEDIAHLRDDLLDCRAQLAEQLEKNLLFPQISTSLLSVALMYMEAQRKPDPEKAIAGGTGD